VNPFRIGRKVALTAKTNNRIRLPLSLIPKAAFAVLFVFSTSACTSTSFDFFGSGSKVDRNISTSTVPKRADETVSDQITVLNAVTSADIVRLAGAPLPWANTSTGSAGVISAISEMPVSNTVCRNFVTTRHSYDGVSRVKGRACLADAGQWTMLSFEPDAS
jgi:17 kDa outer membrane surface antigen